MLSRLRAWLRWPLLVLAALAGGELAARLDDLVRYDVPFFKPLDVGGPITKEALSKGDVDVALLFTTDPGIKKNGWVMLEDDKHLQLAENVVPVIQEDAVDDDVTSLLAEVSAELTDEDYVDLLTKVYIDGEDAEAVAKAWLEDKGLLD